MYLGRLLASLFLVLGTADLVLLNVWLVPAAWPPSSDPIAALAAPAVVERTPEVAETSPQGHAAVLASQGAVSVDSMEATKPPQVAAVTSNATNADVKPEEQVQSAPELEDHEPLAEAMDAIEPRQVAAVVSDLADTKLEPQEQVQSAAELEDHEPLIEATDAIGSQQVVPDLADSVAEPEGEAETPAEPRMPSTTEALLASRDSEKTEQPGDQHQYQILHHAVVRFAFDKDTLRPAGRDMLSRTGRIYRENPDAEIQVDGHTDNRGSEDYNYVLSERRARAVAVLLEAQGIPAGRIQVRGHGPSRPLDAQNNAAARAKNRRVEITIRSRKP